MNLTDIYIDQAKTRRANQFCGMSLTKEQIQLLNLLKENAIKDRGLIDLQEAMIPRRSGKTIVLLKMAEDLGIPLVVQNENFARSLKQRYPHINIMSQAQMGERLRGTEYREAIVDEGVMLRNINSNIKILTGLKGGF